MKCKNFTFFVALLVLIPSVCYTQCSPEDATKYFGCIANERRSNPWPYRRPYSDGQAVAKCLSDAGCQNTINYNRGLFSDFKPQYTAIAEKMWNEYLTVPDNIRQCVRDYVLQFYRPRLGQCMQSLGVVPPSQYPEDIELPFSGLSMPGPNDPQIMKASLQERVDVLHEINICKANQGQAAAVKASDCIDAIRRNFMVKNFCATSAKCTKSQVQNTCTANVDRQKLAMCQCARSYRDNTIANIDRMYMTGSINIMKMVSAFLGFDLNPTAVGQMKKCFTDNGREPIAILKVADDPMLGGLTVSTAEARPEGIQAYRELSYVQYDLPDYCEQCGN